MLIQRLCIRGVGSPRPLRSGNCNTAGAANLQILSSTPRRPKTTDRHLPRGSGSSVQLQERISTLPSRCLGSLGGRLPLIVTVLHLQGPPTNPSPPFTAKRKNAAARSMNTRPRVPVRWPFSAEHPSPYGAAVPVTISRIRRTT